VVYVMLNTKSVENKRYQRNDSITERFKQI
jgi:hypothetical protein